ncbi:MAG: hypothetical protein AAF772_21625, partial [Acidobacteriota bacterium]
AAPAARAARSSRSEELRALARQRTLTSAYSWNQTLLYPFRGAAKGLFGQLGIAAITIDILGGLFGAGLAVAGVRALVPVATLAFGLHIAQTTLDGKNRLLGLGGVDAMVRSVLLALLLIVGALVPAGFFMALRGAHGALGADGGLGGWFALAGLFWLGALGAMMAGTAATGFGPGSVPRLAKHVRALRVGAPHAAMAVNIAFALGLIILLMRTLVAPLTPWFGVPMAGLLEIYSLLLLPHVMGVVVRAHRIELTRLYGGAAA